MEKWLKKKTSKKRKERRNEKKDIYRPTSTFTT